MGRKKGGKNFGNFIEDEKRPIEIPEEEKLSLHKIFTCIDKDFISVQDLIQSSGLSYDACRHIIHEIKSVSDVFGILGYVHRTDYFVYLSHRFKTVGGVTVNAD